MSNTAEHIAAWKSFYRTGSELPKRRLVEDLMDGIEEMYNTFGTEVVREVKRQVAFYGSLVPLLRRLNVPAMGNRINEHKALTEFIFKYGTFLFLTAARNEMLSTEEIERLKALKLLGLPLHLAPSTVKVTSQPSLKEKPHQPEMVQPTIPVAASEKPHSPEPKKHSRYAEPAEEKFRLPVRKRIITSSYYGPDRRTKNRRQNDGSEHGGIDRRETGRRSADRPQVDHCTESSSIINGTGTGPAES